VLAATQLVWLVGASASYFVGAIFGAPTGAGALGATFVLSALIAIAGIGWRAVPRLAIALLLQAPLLVGLGFYALRVPLGDDPFPCFFFHGTALEQLEAFTAIAALSAPVGLLLALDGAHLRRMKAVARTAAPLATALA